MAFLADTALRKRLKLIFAVALPLSVAALVVTLLRQKAGDGPCVVLLGDSITALWQDAPSREELTGLRIVNRGVPGDRTANMLARFHHDVIRFSPRVVVIQGGINDFVSVPLASTEQNLEAMADQANEKGIAVVLATLLPTGKPDSDIAGQERDSGHQKIRELNDWIKGFAAKKHFVVVDYHSALADERGSYLENLSVDGIHPTARGYGRMAPLLRDAVQSALGGK